MKMVFHKLAPYLGLILFTIACYYLLHELKHYEFGEVIRYILQLPVYKILLSILLTGLSYTTLTGYDTFAFRYINRTEPYSKIFKPAFISYAFSNNMGFSLVSGGSLRYRIYSSWGLSGFEVTKIVVFCGLTSWIGVLTLGSITFTFASPLITAAFGLPTSTIRIIGILFLFTTLGYIAGAFFVKQTFTIKGWSINFPNGDIAVRQILLSSAEWILSAAVLYVLLPMEGISYLAFLSVFLLAQVVGIVSQIPGGLGVFESIMVLFLSARLPASEVLSALIAYRGIYYLLPFIGASLMLGYQELTGTRESIQKVSSQVSSWISKIVPHVLAFSVFISGVVLLFSGVTPAEMSRLRWLRHIVPVPVIAISNFFGSLVGIWLLILARGIQRRLDAAYHLTVMLLLVGMAFSLLKGFDYEEAVILGLMLLALFPAKEQFYRKASLFQQRFTPGWIATIIIVLVSMIWLGLFSFRHVNYTQDLWWQFTLEGDAARSLRVMVGVVSFAAIFGIIKLMMLSRIESVPSEGAFIEKAREIINKDRNTESNLALLGDKTLLFNDEQTAFLSYSTEGRSWVVMGDPVGPEPAIAELVWKFRELCDQHDAWPVFYQVREEYLSLYLDLGLTLLKLGEEARVNLQTFSLQGGKWKSIRYMLGKMERDGYSFEIINREDILAHMDVLREISEEWLKEKNTREKGFSLGSFNETYLAYFSFATVKKDGAIVAFANIWESADNEELSVDLMRHRSDVPSGIMDYIFIELMEWGQDQGYRWFNLGMAPLSGIERRAQAPLWNKLASFIYQHGEYFYNFQGLRKYKDKFDPEWRPRYLACPGGLAIPVVLANVTTLISGGWKGVVSK